MNASWYWTPPSPKPYCLSPTSTLELSLRAIWDAASWAAVLILPQIKLNSQLPSCTSFFSWQYHNFFIHSFVDGHLGCFQVLAIVNSVAVNNGMHVSFSILVSSEYMPRTGIARSYGGFIHCFLAPSCCAFTHWVAFEEVSGPRVLFKSGPGNRGLSACGTDRKSVV